MQTSNVQPARSVVLPTTVSPAIRRQSPWPFPAGGVRRNQTDDISEAAQAVIATTARAYLLADLS